MKNCTIITAILCAGSLVSGLFLPIIGSNKQVDKDASGILDIIDRSILPHTAQAPLSGNEALHEQEEIRGLVRFAHNVLKGVGKEVAQVLNLGDNILNRKEADRALDLEPEFLQLLPANLSVKDQVDAILPGTLWCAVHDRAENDNDLGLLRDTDNCCRAHTRCTDNLPAGEEKHGLINTGLFTRSTCDCDQAFYNCLENANNIFAKKVAYTYFTVLGPQCYTYDYPIVDCERRHIKRCVSYTRDETKPKTWQWVDNDLYL
ncbi:uncharacterized protein LOC113387537 [Ctenocephalides felis]|uniref:uncharacterized protein LOC113387537 n=1 Tax=Ctenocephalides felis TaxID=7515 RepID=UPI000E6E2EF6|nr:uncharacterized protein LOC113387537 [Ctenocephalides felis]